MSAQDDAPARAFVRSSRNHSARGERENRTRALISIQMKKRDRPRTLIGRGNDRWPPEMQLRCLALEFMLRGGKRRARVHSNLPIYLRADICYACARVQKSLLIRVIGYMAAGSADVRRFPSSWRSPPSKLPVCAHLDLLRGGWCGRGGRLAGDQSPSFRRRSPQKTD